MHFFILCGLALLVFLVLFIIVVLRSFLFFLSFFVFIHIFFGLKEVSSGQVVSGKRIAVIKISLQNIYYTLYASSFFFNSLFVFVLE